MVKEINITYETLFELLRREKSRDELQKLEPSFFSDVVEYLKEKEDFFEHQKIKQDLFSADEKEKAEKQLINIRKILKELYDRRERKMLEMAIDASRNESVVIETSAMLEEEKKFYDTAVQVLKQFRECILINVQMAKLPEMAEREEKKEAKPEESKEETPKEAATMQEGLRKIKTTHAIPRFIGPDLHEYGPFEEGEEATVPEKIAEVLINKGRAE